LGRSVIAVPRLVSEAVSVMAATFLSEGSSVSAGWRQ
jgi:hypothetical protein